MMLLPILRPVQKSASRLLLASTNAAFDLHDHTAEPQRQSHPPVRPAQSHLASPGAELGPSPLGQTATAVASTRPAARPRWADIGHVDEQLSPSVSSAGGAFGSQPLMWPLVGPYPASAVVYPMLLPVYSDASAEVVGDLSPRNSQEQDAALAIEQQCSAPHELETQGCDATAAVAAAEAWASTADPFSVRTGSSRRQRRKQRNAKASSALKGAPLPGEVADMRRAVAEIQRSHIASRVAVAISSGAITPSRDMTQSATAGSETNMSSCSHVATERTEMGFPAVYDAINEGDLQFWPPTPEFTPPHSPRRSPCVWAEAMSPPVVNCDPAELGEEVANQIVANLASDDHVQKQALLSWVVNSAWLLTSTSSGCRVVQKALDIGNSWERVALADGLKGHVREASISPHGNHVLQKCITVMPPDRIQFVLTEMQGYATTAARHRYGCRVLERLIEHCPHQQTLGLIEEVLSGTEKLCRHAFGNFVVQHILEHGISEHKQRVAEVLHADAVRLAKHRVASHVMKSALVHCEAEDRQRLTQALSADAGELSDLAHHHCGSFVVREMKRAALGQ